MKKIVTTILVAIALIAMMGTAAANPSRVDIVPGDDSNPLYHPLDGSIQSYPVLINEMVVSTSTTTRYIEIWNAGLTSITLTGPGGVSLTAGPGTSASQTWIVPADTASQTFTLDVKASSSGAVTIVNNLGTTLATGAAIATSDFGAGSNSFDVPEFPTIALPIAAILGLAFIFQRRREEE